MDLENWYMAFVPDLQIFRTATDGRAQRNERFRSAVAISADEFDWWLWMGETVEDTWHRRLSIPNNRAGACDEENQKARRCSPKVAAATESAAGPGL